MDGAILGHGMQGRYPFLLRASGTPSGDNLDAIGSRDDRLCIDPQQRAPLADHTEAVGFNIGGISQRTSRGFGNHFQETDPGTIDYGFHDFADSSSGLAAPINHGTHDGTYDIPTSMPAGIAHSENLLSQLFDVFPGGGYYPPPEFRAPFNNVLLYHLDNSFDMAPRQPMASAAPNQSVGPTNFGIFGPSQQQGLDPDVFSLGPHTTEGRPLALVPLQREPPKLAYLANLTANGLSARHPSSVLTIENATLEPITPIHKNFTVTWKVVTLW
ncbi:hypothetical protein MMC11_007163 [Xylographa trunciseda]|nr:hypothetical protein [Xylographa trunciseda]